MTDLELDEVLVHYWPLVVIRAERIGTPWQIKFARAIEKKSHFKNWRPTSRQLEMILALVDEIRPNRQAAPDLIDARPMTRVEQSMARVRQILMNAETIDA